MKSTNAIVIKLADDKYFAFVKNYPAAAVAASNLNDLFARLRIALTDVIQFDYKIENMPS